MGAESGNKAALERMKELIPLLDRAAKAYYQESSEIMPNQEYDALYDELANLEKKTGIVLAGSVTHKVGYQVLSELPKKAHRQPRLSLDKTKEVSALADFLGAQPGILMWKLDGLTVVLTYENGVLVEALTRGNGEIGEVVTENAKFFHHVPLTIPYQGFFSVRGEAVISYPEFERINSELPDTEAKYKNPRNLCSGSVRQLNTRITAERNVDFIVYELLDCEGVDFHDSRTEQLAFVASQGFAVVDHPLVTRDSVAEEVERYAEKIQTYEIPSDGLVLQYESISYGVGLGRTAKFPRHSIAFKWRDEIAETTLQEIEWSASRTGLINPVAIFDPVELEGTTVTRASVHNVSILRSLKLGIGDRITVYKANMIIPQIAENLTGSDSVVVPDTCPVCGGKTEIRDEDGVQTLYCLNPACMAKKIKQLSLFVSRDAMNIEGLSEMTLEKLVDVGMIHEMADIFRLRQHRQDIMQMEGFGEKSADNLLVACDRARTTNAVRLLYALGVPNIGLSGARVIAGHFSYDFAKMMQADADELSEIEGIGPVMAEGYAAFMRQPENRKMIEGILSEITLEIPETAGSAAADSPISGMTFVITGDVHHFANRNALKAYIEERGGKVTGSVTGKTSYLINNDVLSSSNKNRKAKELGVPILSEEDFLNLAGTEGGENAR